MRCQKPWQWFKNLTFAAHCLPETCCATFFGRVRTAYFDTACLQTIDTQGETSRRVPQIQCPPEMVTPSFCLFLPTNFTKVLPELPSKIDFYLFDGVCFILFSKKFCFSLPKNGTNPRTGGISIRIRFISKDDAAFSLWRRHLWCRLLSRIRISSSLLRKNKLSQFSCICLVCWGPLLIGARPQCLCSFFWIIYCEWLSYLFRAIPIWMDSQVHLFFG